MENRLLSVEESATQLGVKVSTIRRRILERRIAYVKIGRSVRIPQSEIDRIVQKGFRPALAEK